MAVTAVTPFREPDRTAAPALGTERAPQTMPTDVFRTSDHYLVQIDLPGIAHESLEVTADDPRSGSQRRAGAAGRR